MHHHSFDVFFDIFSDPEVSLPIVSRKFFADLNGAMHCSGAAGLFACADASTEIVYNLQTQESVAVQYKCGDVIKVSYGDVMKVRIFFQDFMHPISS